MSPQSGRRKERGRVELSRVVAVECVDSAVFQRDWVFQLCYLSDDREQFVLYIAAVTSQERDQWLDYIRRRECLLAPHHTLASGRPGYRGHIGSRVSLRGGHRGN